jgi:hypothetical protein
MAVITGDFPPGPYTATYDCTLNSGAVTDVGLMEGPLRHQQNIVALPIYASLWGRHVIDYVVQGGGVFVVAVMKEWDAGSKALMWPFNASHGIFPIVGELINTYFGQLVLTALAGTPAATEGPATRTYPICGLLPGHNLDITLGPTERNVPVVICALPEQNSLTVGQAKYFTDT